MGTKISFRYSSKRKSVPENLLEALDFIYSMCYSCRELRELTNEEVLFIRKRLKEEKINESFDDVIKALDIGVYYDDEGNRFWESKKNDKL